MEAMGTLAGGTHDFNNILGAILGYGEPRSNRPRQAPCAALSKCCTRERAKVLVDHSRLQPAAWVNAPTCISSRSSRKRWNSSRFRCPPTFGWKTLVAGDAALIGDSTTCIRSP